MLGQVRNWPLLATDLTQSSHLQIVQAISAAETTLHPVYCTFSSKVMSISCPLLVGECSLLTKQGQSRAVAVRKPESALSLQVVQAISMAKFRVLAHS